MKPAATTRRIIETLAEQYPHADTELHYRNAFELLVATILSAQSTDARVNLVTPALFARFPDAPALARAKPAALEKQIMSTGFFRQKSKALIGIATTLIDEHGGEVPASASATSCSKLARFTGFAPGRPRPLFEQRVIVVAIFAHRALVAQRLRLADAPAVENEGV